MSVEKPKAKQETSASETKKWNVERSRYGRHNYDKFFPKLSAVISLIREIKAYEPGSKADLKKFENVLAAIEEVEDLLKEREAKVHELRNVQEAEDEERWKEEKEHPEKEGKKSKEELMKERLRKDLLGV